MNKRLRPIALAGLFLLLFGGGSASAVETAFWTVSGRDDVSEGEANGITIGVLGTLELAPSLDEFGEIEEYYVWIIIADDDGNLYVGTGDEGKVFRVDSDGKTELLFDSIEFDILSLELGPDGELYAGTSPDGVIYRIDKNGESRTFFDSPEHYIWSLEFDDSGTLYAGTGERGKIYKIDRSGNGELFYDSPETNALTLIWDDPRKRLLLGGDGNGLVMSIDKSGEARVIFDSPRDEVGDIVAMEDGTIYVAVAGDESSKKKKNSNGNGGVSESGKKGLIYRIDPNGAVHLLWQSEAEYLFTIISEGDGNLLAGTGTPGKLVRISPEGEGTDLEEISESQLLTLCRTGGSVYIGTGNQGAIYHLAAGYAEEGTYESETKDVINLAKWGKLRWWGETPGKTSVTFSTRTGNTESPDDTWADWEEIGSGDDGGAIRSPAGRFLQWRAELSGNGSATPRVDRVKVAFKEHNLAPRVFSVNVVHADNNFFDGPADPRPETMHQVLSDGTRIEYYPVQLSDSGPGKALELWTRAIRTLRWEAADENGDKLIYDVFYRAEGDVDWKLFDEDLKMNYYSWDTRSMPDGVYRVRVVAKDIGANPEATALEGSKVSSQFEVDNTAPGVMELGARREGSRVNVKGRATDESSPLLRAEYSLNAEEWHAVDPADEIYDSKQEEFSFTVEADGEGEQVIILRVTDQAGNVGLGKAVVR